MKLTTKKINLDKEEDWKTTTPLVVSARWNLVAWPYCRKVSCILLEYQSLIFGVMFSGVYFMGLGEAALYSMFSCWVGKVVQLSCIFLFQETSHLVFFPGCGGFFVLGGVEFCPVVFCSWAFWLAEGSAWERHVTSWSVQADVHVSEAIIATISVWRNLSCSVAPPCPEDPKNNFSEIHLPEYGKSCFLLWHSRPTTPPTFLPGKKKQTTCCTRWIKFRIWNARSLAVGYAVLLSQFDLNLSLQATPFSSVDHPRRTTGFAHQRTNIFL